MRHESAQQLMSESRWECQQVAQGPFTPIVLDRYEGFGGKGWLLGHPSETVDGNSCIIWTSKDDSK